MQIVFSGSFPKDPSEPESNEDCLHLDLGSGRFALCDGASESYDSKSWAAILAEKFVSDPAINQSWIDDVVSAYSTLFDFQNLSWSKQAAFEKGSFATLLGVEINSSLDHLEIIAIGDSIALLVDEGHLVKSWPYTEAEQFKGRPTLLSTQPALNEFVGANGFYSQTHISCALDALIKPTLICVTDALGEWALQKDEQGAENWRKLLDIHSDEELAALVVEARCRKTMKTDDSTLLIINLAKPASTA